jgi:gliding motility-associated-like protein
LAPGAVGRITKDYTITQGDIDAGQVTNSALAIGQDPRGVDVEDISGTAVDNDDPTVLLLNQAPEINLVLEGNFQDENGDGSAQVGETIRYSFRVANMGNVPLKDVWVEDIILGFGRSNGTMNLDIAGIDASTFWGLYPITQADIIAGRVINIAKANGTSPLGIEVQDISNDGTELVVVLSGCTIKVFNAVSADGDGFNDTLYIQGIECYPSNTVQVFNRWGVKVFDVQGYDNSSKVFRGMSEGRVTANQSEGLPNGTYFYVLNYVDLNGSGISKSGYLHLIN